MHRTIILGAILALALPAAAFNLGIHAAVKSPADHQPPPADPEVLARGGDTLDDPIPLAAIPILLSGTTAGYHDDHDEACPHGASNSPDVVYTFVPGENMAVDIDLRDSDFDTKIYLYREDLTLVDCNDDFHLDGTSRLESVVLVAKARYYVVVDGYGGAAGNFLLAIGYHDRCQLANPDAVEQEAEPPLAAGYVDAHNGGCNSAEHDSPLQAIEAWFFRGTSGWYRDQAGAQCRDTDWFIVDIPRSGTLEIWANAEQPTFVAELGPQVCGGVGVLQSMVVGPCEEDVLTVIGEPGTSVWIWVGPTTFESPTRFASEYSYVLTRHDFLAPTSASAADWAKVRELFQ